MIYNNNRDVTAIMRNGKKITKVVTFARVVWSAIRACFSKQGWVNIAGWYNNEGWNN